MRAISPMVKNSLRFDTEVPAVPWSLPSKFELPLDKHFRYYTRDEQDFSGLGFYLTGGLKNLQCQANAYELLHQL